MKGGFALLRGLFGAAARESASATIASQVGAGGNWARIAEQEGGAIAQKTGTSCVSACGEMLTGKSQSQLIKAIGAPSNAQSLARALGKGWRGGYVGPENLNILLKSGQPFAAEFKEVGERLAHMVVVDGVNSAGQVLIRVLGVSHDL